VLSLDRWVDIAQMLLTPSASTAHFTESRPLLRI
jgi:hypothetical protein